MKWEDKRKVKKFMRKDKRKTMKYMHFIVPAKLREEEKKKKVTYWELIGFVSVCDPLAKSGVALTSSH